MQINLPANLERSLLVEIQDGHFASLDDAIAEAVRLLLRTTSGEAEAESAGVDEPTAPGFKPIWEVFEGITASVPEEEWSKLPGDGAEDARLSRLAEQVALSREELREVRAKLPPSSINYDEEREMPY